MKKATLALLCFFLLDSALGQTGNGLAIIPEPVQVVKKTGVYTLPQRLAIAVPKPDSLGATLSFLKNRLQKGAGRTVSIADGTIAIAPIKLLINTTPDTTLGREGYRLSVTGTGVIIKANAPAGIF